MTFGARPEPTEKRLTLADQKKRLLDLSAILSAFKRDRKRLVDLLDESPSKRWIISALDNKIISVTEDVTKCAVALTHYNRKEIEADEQSEST